MDKRNSLIFATLGSSRPNRLDSWGEEIANDGHRYRKDESCYTNPCRKYSKVVHIAANFNTPVIHENYLPVPANDPRSVLVVKRGSDCCGSSGSSCWEERKRDGAEKDHHYIAISQTGRRNPSVRTLVRVANAFGIAVSDLFDGEVRKRAR